MDRLLTLRALARLLAVPRSRLTAWIESGEFPPPVVLPDGGERWRLSTVRAWLADLLPAGHCHHDEDDGEAVEPAEQPKPFDLAALPELAREILTVLSEAAEETLPSREVAKRIGGNVDPANGDWKRATRRLREAGLIRGDKTLGLMLGPRWSEVAADFTDHDQGG